MTAVTDSSRIDRSNEEENKSSAFAIWIAYFPRGTLCSTPRKMFAVVNFPPMRVLLATDFSAASRAAFQAALVLCLSFRADLYILNVFEYANANPPESGGMLLELDSFYHDAEQSLDNLVEEARHSDITCDGRIGSGTSHSTILETAETEHADIIVLGTRSIHGFERLVFGSTAEAVLRAANCPVFTVGPRAATQRPEEGAAPGVVVFATDFHDTTTEALQTATSFCSSMNLSLHCLHVLPRGVEDNSHKGIIPVIITEALQHLVATVENKVGPPVCAVTYGSEISSAVVDYARAHKARLIVLGVRRASLAASHTPAHIAYRIIAEAPCPVLTVAFPLGHETGRLDPIRDAQDINEVQPLMRLRQPTIQ